LKLLGESERETERDRERQRETSEVSGGEMGYSRESKHNVVTSWKYRDVEYEL
jgi:D-alanyl-D-alanine carboxypeptidase